METTDTPNVHSTLFLIPAAAAIGHINSALCGLKGMRLFGIKYWQGRNFFDMIFIYCNIQKEKQYTKQHKNTEYKK